MRKEKDAIGALESGMKGELAAFQTLLWDTRLWPECGDCSGSGVESVDRAGRERGSCSTCGGFGIVRVPLGTWPRGLRRMRAGADWLESQYYRIASRRLFVAPHLPNPFSAPGRAIFAYPRFDPHCRPVAYKVVIRTGVFSQDPALAGIHDPTGGTPVMTPKDQIDYAADAPELAALHAELWDEQMWRDCEECAGAGLLAVPVGSITEIPAGSMPKRAERCRACGGFGIARFPLSPGWPAGVSRVRAGAEYTGAGWLRWQRDRIVNRRDQERPLAKMPNPFNVPGAAVFASPKPDTHTLHRGEPARGVMLHCGSFPGPPGSCARALVRNLP